MRQFSEATRKAMSESAKARCTPEWRAMRSERLATKLNPDQVQSLYDSGMTQAEIAEKLGVTQKVVFGFMKRSGIKARTAAKRNQIGENNSFWRGGETKTEKGYILVKSHGHPRAKGPGWYVQLHVLTLEDHIGRYLKWFGPSHPETEVCHHKNEDKTDNRIENLELMTFSEHVKHHNKVRREVKNAGNIK